MSYVGEVLADNPELGFWLLSEQSGTVALEAHGDRTRFVNGTYVNAPTLGAPSPIATNYAVETGGTSYVALPIINLSGSFSIEFWFSYTSGPAIIFDTGDDTFPGDWRLDLTGTNPVIYVTATGYRTVTSITSASLKTGAAHHIVLTYWNTGEIRFYVDKVLRDTWTATHLRPDFIQVSLGRKGGDTTTADATFAAFAMYATVLSAARVAAHYDARGQYRLGIAPVTVSALTAKVHIPGTAGVRVTAMPLPVSVPVQTTSSLVLASSTVDESVPADDAPTLVVEPLHIVSPAVPSPTLVNGRPT